MGMSQELEVFLWNSKKKKGILKNIGAQMTSSVWTKKKKTFHKMSSIMFQKKKSVMQAWNDVMTEISFLYKLSL